MEIMIESQVRIIIMILVTSLMTSCDADDDISTVLTDNKTIRIGYFVQESNPPYRIGAIQLAIDRARQEGLLDGYNIR
jgi:hypothetical protein